MSDQSPVPQQDQPRTLYYFIGIGAGFVPLILALLALLNSSIGSTLGLVGLILYVVEFIATIVFLAIERVRFIGYGLLTMFLVSPVVFFIACTVNLLQRPI
jgi:hypothetical protein